jgi:hypothetical protein
MGQAPHFEPRFIDYALNNLRVRRNASSPLAELSLSIETTGDLFGAEESNSV